MGNCRATLALTYRDVGDVLRPCWLVPRQETAPAPTWGLRLAAGRMIIKVLKSASHDVALVHTAVQCQFVISHAIVIEALYVLCTDIDEQDYRFIGHERRMQQENNSSKKQATTFN